jgi:Domain of unknown function (DUF5615)
VRVLIEENLPHDLVGELTGHKAATVQGLGWSGMSNGELLLRAGGRFDAFVTMDRNLEHQHAVRHLTFGIVVIRAQSNRMVHLRPLIADVLAALGFLKAGEVRQVGP